MKGLYDNRELVIKYARLPLQEAFNKHGTIVGEQLFRWSGRKLSDNPPLVLDISESTPDNGTHIQLRLDGITVLRFYINYYPACCAMVQINYFYYLAVLSESLVHAFMDAILGAIKSGHYDNLRRVVLNCVEAPRRKHEDYPKHIFGDINIPVSETDIDKIYYPHIYTWATSKKHQQLITVNHNTQNLIHFIDCMWELKAEPSKISTDTYEFAPV